MTTKERVEMLDVIRKREKDMISIDEVLGIIDSVQNNPRIDREHEAFAIRERILTKRTGTTPQKGEWIKAGAVKPFGDDTVQCSACGFFTDVDSDYNYCPSCGTPMK